jgi:hypothetical protein
LRACNGSVQRQLIWGVAAVHALMMTLFVYDLSLRQKDFLVESQASQGTSLAKNLGLIAAPPCSPRIWPGYRN